MRYRHLLIVIVAISFGLVGVCPVGAAEGFDPSVCASAAETAGKKATLTQSCLDMIAKYPRPELKDIQQDAYTLGRYNFYKVGPDAVTTYAAPNGAANGEIAKGFNFVNVIDESTEGWLKTQDGKWIKRSDATPTKASFFRGVQLPATFEHPFAWVLDKSQIYASEYPGGPAAAATKRVLRRYERVNIFASAVDDKGSRWYMIGANQWVKQTFLSVIQTTPRPDGISGRWVAVDLFEQTLIAYENDKPVFATLISSGLPKFETPEGTYKVWAKMERDGMSGAAGAPSAYALQSVPWVMYFKDSFSLHGTYWHDLFGYPRSHGCVNMSISDASYLFKWFAGAKPNQDGEIVNTVYVYKSAPTPGSSAATPESP
jgi:hypothetical protein